MHEYIIDGGYPIRGSITAGGNKNAALPCIAAEKIMDAQANKDLNVLKEA